MERVEYLRIPLERILAATNNFDDENNYIAKGGFGSVYKGELSSPDGPPVTVAVKRLNSQLGQGDDQFHVEIAMLSEYKHPNLASLVGFSDEGNERILVYVHESKGSLDQYICKPDLTWVQRLHISIGIARGLRYLHDELGSTHRVLHRDIKSANVLLDEGWEAKVSDFGLSTIAPANMAISFVPTAPCGTFHYVDPAYIESRVLTKESDVYSFGVVLFEILCGRLAFEDRDGFLVPQAKHHYEEKTLDKIIIPDLRKQMKPRSLDIFSEIAYQCLNHNRRDRPRMGKILKELEKALEYQDCPKPAEIALVETLGHQVRLNASDFELLMEKVQHLKIPLENIRQATSNFDKQNFIGEDEFGRGYKGKLSWSNSFITVTVKRLDPRFGQGDYEFLKEVAMISCYRHKNLVSLVGYCDEANENVLVYVHESKGSLDNYIRNPDLTWKQRLQISIGAARGLNYLHDGVGLTPRILHRDIKSASIQLNDDLSGFGLSKIGPESLEGTFVVASARGTFAYLDPLFVMSGVLTKESDVYSFGVVLFEILCGRLAHEDGKPSLGPLVEIWYRGNKLDEIIDPNLRKQMKLNSLNKFSAIAYQCLKYDQSERPTMAKVIKELENALDLQLGFQTTRLVA